MKIRNTTYNLIDRKMTVILVVLSFIISSFFASASEHQVVSYGTLPEIARFSYDNAAKGGVAFDEGRTSRSIHLPVRGKAKVKGFYKQYFSSAATVRFSLLRRYIAPLTTSSVATASRPDYYNFLFRLTPF
jgi:hypothetical protein